MICFIREVVKIREFIKGNGWMTRRAGWGLRGLLIGLSIMGSTLVISRMEGESLRMVRGKCMKASGSTVPSRVKASGRE